VNLEVDLRDDALAEDVVVAFEVERREDRDEPFSGLGVV
jgi:hypothetical protein